MATCASKLNVVRKYQWKFLLCVAMISLHAIWEFAKLESIFSASFSFDYFDENLQVDVVVPVLKYLGGQSNVSTFDHPHAGARDADGYWNYVPDVTFIRRKVLAQTLAGNSSQYFPLLGPEMLDQVCQVAPGLGVEGMEGYKVLRHVQLNGSNPLPEFTSSNQTDVNDSNDNTTIAVPSIAPTADVSNLPPARILCAVYTYEGKHDQLQAIVDTWGWRCDGFFAASTKTVPDLGAVDLPHLGEEAYGNMWQKSRSILAFIYDNYIDDYDYFHLAGDDTYLIVENLRNYLRILEAQEGGRDVRPLYMGLQAKFGWERVVYNIGGPGYILNNLVLRRLVNETFPTCETEGVHIAEDIIVARCLFDLLGILPIDTADAAHRQRFFDMNPAEIAVFDPIGTMYNDLFVHWAKDHGWRTGINLVSTQSVAFHHLKSPVSMRRHHAIIYNSCPIGTVLRNASVMQTPIQN